MSLVAKLLKVQSEIGEIKKDGKNPHFKSQYATLPNVLGQVLPVLKENGLLFSTRCDITNIIVEIVDVETGEIRCTTLPMLGANTMQGLGQAHTYAMRYGVLSLLGLCPEIDDDGNELSIVTIDKLKELFSEIKSIIPENYIERFTILLDDKNPDANAIKKAYDYLLVLKGKK